jgi:hypothetical protein
MNWERSQKARGRRWLMLTADASSYRMSKRKLINSSQSTKTPSPAKALAELVALLGWLSDEAVAVAAVLMNVS